MEDPNRRSLLPLLKGGLLIFVIGFFLNFFLLTFGVKSKIAIFVGWEFIPIAMITMMVRYMKQYHLKETKDEDREYYRMIVRIALMVFMAVLVPVIVFL